MAETHSFDPRFYKISKIKSLTSKEQVIKTSLQNLASFYKKISNQINSSKFRNLITLDKKTLEFNELNSELQKLISTRDKIKNKRLIIRKQLIENKINSFSAETAFLENFDFSQLLSESENLNEKYGQIN